MEQLVKEHRESSLGSRLPAYDGRKSLYTAGPLPFQSREFQISLMDEDDGSNAPRFGGLILCCRLAEVLKLNRSLLLQIYDHWFCGAHQWNLHDLSIYDSLCTYDPSHEI